LGRKVELVRDVIFFSAPLEMKLVYQKAKTGFSSPGIQLAEKITIVI
jgi:hypothetical protein